MDQASNNILKGRGAQINPANRFHQQYYETEWEENEKTEYIIVHPKTILNKVDSPDIGMAWSLNPYQGYSACIEFEQKILVKKNAAKLLEDKIKNKNWDAAAIMLAQRLNTIKILAKAGISVNVMLAPIIPGINNHEIMAMAKTVSELGARSIAYT